MKILLIALCKAASGSSFVGIGGFINSEEAIAWRGRFRLLERVAQTHFVLGSTYDTDDPVSHGSEDISHGGNENSDARLHDRNSASARRFSGSHLNRGAPSFYTTDEDGRRNKIESYFT